MKLRSYLVRFYLFFKIHNEDNHVLESWSKLQPLCVNSFILLNALRHNGVNSSIAVFEQVFLVHGQYIFKFLETVESSSYATGTFSGFWLQ